MSILVGVASSHDQSGLPGFQIAAGCRSHKTNDKWMQEPETPNPQIETRNSEA